MGHATLLHTAAWLTGAILLAAQLLWIRGIGRAVGALPTTFAATIALTLAGVGLGAAIASRFAPGSARPARAAALCLLVAGLWIGASPFAIAWLPDWQQAFREILGAGTGPRGWMAIVAAPIVLVPSFLLGAVFPYLVRGRVAELRHAGGRTGRLFAAQAFGAAVAVVLVVLLLTAAGETLLLRGAGAAALLGALLLLLGDRPLPHGSGPVPEALPGAAAEGHGAVVGLFVAGVGAFGALVAWQRLMGPTIGQSMPGAAVLLVLALLGLALGALVAGGLAARLSHCDRALSIVLASAGLLLLASVPLAGGIPTALLVGSTDGRLAQLLVGAATSVLPSMFFFGAAFPLAVRVRAEWTGTVAAPAGRLFAWNVAGGVLGSLVAGLVLLPLLGAEKTIFAWALVCVATAALMRLQGGTRSSGGLPALVTASPLLLLLWPGVLSGWLQSSPQLPEVVAAHRPRPVGLALADDAEDAALYAELFGGRPARAFAQPDAPLLPRYQGVVATYTLLEEPGDDVGVRLGALRAARFAANDPDTPARSDVALSLVPILMHPAPQRALVIGFGAGWTTETFVRAGVRHVDVAEADPALLEAVRAYRGHPLLVDGPDARARLVVSDGRSLLHATAGGPADGRYDVIASQPGPPSLPWAGALFTREAFQLARDALTPQGVFAQSLELATMSPALLETALATFLAVFPETWIWRFRGKLVLVGFTRPPRIDPARWERLLAGPTATAELAARAGLPGPGGVWRHFALDTLGVGALVPPGTAVATDDRPRVELGLARRAFEAPGEVGVEGFVDKGFPPDMTAALPDVGIRDRWLAGAVEAWLDEGQLGIARMWKKHVPFGFTAEGRRVRARLALAEDDPVEAGRLLLLALRDAPDRADLAAARIDALARVAQADPAQADAVLREVGGLRANHPDNGPLQAAVARALRTLGRAADARAAFEQALEATAPPAPPGTGIELARLLASFEQADVSVALDRMRGDPALRTDPEAIELFLRMLSPEERAVQAEELERVLRGLDDSEGLRWLRRAQRDIARLDFRAAASQAERATEHLGRSAVVWETLGLALLGHGARMRSLGRPDRAQQTAALSAFREALSRAARPAASRERLDRILRWFGQDPAVLGPASEKAALR